MCVIAAGAGIAAGGSIVGAGINASAAGNAANAQEQAAANANATQQQMFNTTNAEQAPWRVGGTQAVNALSQFYGLGGINTTGTGAATTSTPGAAGTPNFNQIISQMPGYQFQLQQGTQAVDRNLAAQGLLQSGAAGKELQQFGQGLAGSYAQQYVGGLQSLAGLGQSSVQASGYLGQQTANQIGSNQIYAGNAQATGYANQAQAINGGLAGITGAYGYATNPYSSPYSPYAQPSNPYMDQSAMMTYNNNQYGSNAGLMPGGNGYMLNTPGLN
jgi:hypothetical protein